MSESELRDAATLMRARAESATRGTWRTSQSPTNVWSDRDPAGFDAFHVASCHDAIGHTGAASQADAKHIASWQPEVAFAVAAWLEETALIADEGTGWAPGEALAVARAYLGIAS